MRIKEEVFAVKCDCCGGLLDDENLYPESEIPTIMSCDGWKCLGDKDYCPDCWSYDDDDDIVTKDGRKFDGDTYEEILTEEQKYHLDYLKGFLDPTLTITELRTNIIKAILLHRSMVGSFYKSALGDEIRSANKLLAERKKTAPQWQLDCYNTFGDNRIFYNMQIEGFPESESTIV